MPHNKKNQKLFPQVFLPTLHMNLILKVKLNHQIVQIGLEIKLVLKRPQIYQIGYHRMFIHFNSTNCHYRLT